MRSPNSRVTTRPRDAPSDCRTASSRCRAAARAISSLVTLAQTMTSVLDGYPVRSRCEARCATTSRASSSAPWMNVDLRRRSTGRPIAYIPGASTTTPPSCRSCPCGRGPARRASDNRDESRSPRRSSGSRRSRGRDRSVRRPARAVGAKRSGGPTSLGCGCARAQSSNASSSRSIFRSASANWLRSPPENSARPSRIAASRPTSVDAGGARARSGRASCAPACRPAAATAAGGRGSGRRSRRSADSRCPTASIHHRTSRPR